MKTKSLIQVLFILLLLFMLSYSVFAIQGSDSSGTITGYSGITGAAAASGSSSDSAGNGGRVSAGSSPVSSSYADATGTISGSSGADLSTSDPEQEAESDSGTEESESGALNSIPSGGGGGGGGAEGSAAESGEAATAEQTTVEAEASAQEAEKTTETTAETTTEAAAETAAESAVTVAVELSEGSSITLAPQTGAAGVSVLKVTATTATIVITSATGGNSITGGVIYSTDQETTMSVGQTIDVDSDGDGVADLQITLTRIGYNAETGMYQGIFTLMYLNPLEEVVSFVQGQVERGEVAFVSGSSIEEISFAYWVWIIVALIVIGVLALVGWVLFDKKNKKHLPTTIPTHYFEKLVRQEVSTHKEEPQKVKTQELKKEEVKKKRAQELKNETKKQGTQTIINLNASKKKKTKRKKKKKTKKKRKTKKR